jgi:hypothetical protein
VQEYFDIKDKREWVDWAGKILMLRLHAAIEMEKAVARIAEIEALEAE